MARHQLPGFRPILVPGPCDCPEAVAEAEAERRRAEQEARAEGELEDFTVRKEEI